MSYPGNERLADEIRQRVASTFDQTLSLADAGSRQEAILGCEFILRLDPQFRPARTLLERLQQEGDGPVDTSGLGMDSAEEAADTATAAASGEAPEWLQSELQDLLERRDFATLMDVANKHTDTVAGDPALREIVDTARSRKEAEPYLRSFMESAYKARMDGKPEVAEALLAKARELDPTHPELQSGEAAAPALEIEPTALDTPGKPALEIEPTALDTPGAPPQEPVESFADLNEPGQRITHLLAEGQAAFERGEYQTAIDSWSRIFLIDIDHAEANRRIEEARQLKAEGERRVEEAFHEAVGLFEAGNRDGAKEAFERVLAMEPQYLAAKEYLDRLESGDVMPTPPVAGPSLEIEAPPASAPTAAPSLEEEIFVPPEPGGAGPPGGALELDEDLFDEHPPPEPQRVPRPKASSSSRSFLMVAAVVLVLVAGIGWVVYSQWDRFFPNSAEETSGGGGSTDPLARARALHESGQTAMAVAQLRNVPPDSPAYAEAQALLAQLETASGEPTRKGPTEEEMGRRNDLVAAARRADQRAEYLRIPEYLEEAATIQPLSPGETTLLDTARQHLEALDQQLTLFRQGDWEFALPDLWNLHEANPDDRDVTLLIIDSYYNLGVRDLQRGDPDQAAGKFQEALNLAPEDRELQRLRRFATQYSDRPADLLYRIFVKYLPFR